MASSDKELEQQLTEAGKKLEEPPSSVDELLPLLDQIESCLSKVEQSPSKSMQSALSPSLKSLVADKLFRHSDNDVKVAVASCISEITRITAPDAPYDDEQMKEVFQLIVSSFENLSDQSSRSYAKRTSILETVAKVRSCVVMLDLECDALIIEMFQHFLKSIRDDHPENVFSSMETIMTLVLEESEDISLELLSPLLATIKKDNEEVLPVAWKLGERVLKACSAKVKPYLVQAVKSSSISLDDFSEVVASICEESGPDEQNDVHTASEHVVDESNPERTLDEPAQVEVKTATEAASAEKVDHASDRSPKSAVSNGVAQTGEEDSLADSNSSKKHETAADQSKSSDAPSNTEPDNLTSDKIVDAEIKADQTTKKRGKKPTISIKLTEPSDGPHHDNEKEAEKLLDDKTDSKDMPSSAHEQPSVETAVCAENEKETSIRPSSLKAGEGESTNVASPSLSSLPEESHAKKGVRPKKKDGLNKEAVPSAGGDSGKPSEETSDSEAKPQKRLGKKAPTGNPSEDKSPIIADASAKESGSTSDSEAKPLKLSGKKVDARSNNGDGSKQAEDKSRRARGKAISEKDVTKAAAQDDDKETLSSTKSAAKSIKDEHQPQETPKTNSKRKRTPVVEKASDDKEFGDTLVGSKIKVWWPKDRKYYEGVVDFYDHVKKKHRILYNDGDVEVLNLKRERWEFLVEESETDESEEQAADQSSPDSSSEMPLKKKIRSNSEAPKKVGGASSSKSKSTKSARKSEDDGKVDGKSKDRSKAVAKSKTDNVGKSKDHTPKSGKSTDVSLKTASKSKNDDSEKRKSSKSKEDDSGTPKTSAKSKQVTLNSGKSKHETPKASSNAKGKPTKSGGKSNANGAGKLKSGSSKAKESDDVKENLADSTKVPDSAKGKSASSSKAQGIETKSGKKRPRGSKS